MICFYFQPWMVPGVGLLVFIKQYFVRTLATPSTISWDEGGESDLDDDEEDDKDKVHFDYFNFKTLN